MICKTSVIVNKINIDFVVDRINKKMQSFMSKGYYYVELIKIYYYEKEL